jgi:beta-lactamase regulating signal transducer with metallopeptidase domain
MLLDAWADTLITTALLVFLVLIVRKPFARHFGPRLTYGLWMVPALRLALPPLPFAAPLIVTPEPEPVAEVAVAAPAGLPVAAAAPAAEPYWGLASLTPLLFAIWAAGMAAVLVAAAISHRRFKQSLLADAVELAPLGTIRLVMSGAVEGPVAFGLWRRYVAVPHDFFARYAAEERALAIDHELSHHRHGDLWANGAALVLLAVQWFNPFAWRAIRAFRFDQEAACDARVLSMAGREDADGQGRNDRTARYAAAIVKAAVGPRLSLAAPMAVHDNLQERLTMLTQQDISKKRGLAGRLLVGGATLAVLATTATLVPAGIVVAKAQTADVPAPPAPPEAPLPPEAPEAPGVMLFTEHEEDSTNGDRGTKREVHRIVIREDDEAASAAMPARAHGEGATRRIEIRTPGSLSREDVLATLKEQGITGARAEAIADRLEAKRSERIRTVMAPIPPMPPLPPIPPMPDAAWSAHGKNMALVKCREGAKAAPIVNRDEREGSKRSQVYMFTCHDTAESRAARLSALKKAREAFVEGERARGLSDHMRAKVAADIDKAIAEIEKSGH